MTPSLVMYAGLAAAALHLLMRALKSGQAQALFAQLSLAPIPDKAVPWIAVGLGLAGGIADALVQGQPFAMACETVFAGLFAGTGAIALHETVVKVREPAPQAAPPDEQP